MIKKIQALKRTIRGFKSWKNGVEELVRNGSSLDEVIELYEWGQGKEWMRSEVTLECNELLKRLFIQECFKGNWERISRWRQWKPKEIEEWMKEPWMNGNLWIVTIRRLIEAGKDHAVMEFEGWAEKEGIGSTIKAQYGDDFWTANRNVLIRAGLAKGTKEIVRWCLKKPKINAWDRDWDGILAAIQNGRLEVLKLVEENNPEKSAEMWSNPPRKAWLYAAYKGHWETVDWVLERIHNEASKGDIQKDWSLEVVKAWDADWMNWVKSVKCRVLWKILEEPEGVASSQNECVMKAIEVIRNKIKRRLEGVISNSDRLSLKEFDQWIEAWEEKQVFKKTVSKNEANREVQRLKRL